MMKPEILFHCSEISEQEILLPFSKKKDSLGRFEGIPKLFAAPTPQDAAPFLVRRDGFRQFKGHLGRQGVTYMIVDNEEAYHRCDQGGSIYVAANGIFETVVRNNSRNSSEFFSLHPIKPLCEKRISSGYEFVMKCGVQLYFVTREKWNELFALKRDVFPTAAMLQKLTSENQKTNIGYQNLFRMFPSRLIYNRQNACNFCKAL